MFVLSKVPFSDKSFWSWLKTELLPRNVIRAEAVVRQYLADCRDIVTKTGDGPALLVLMYIIAPPFL
jgi:hypothetical protein